jgi:glycosyltransferase involved in cell wall biosynthesis
MNKILIDGRLLSNNPTGISRYTNEVIHALIGHFGQENISVLVDAEYTINSNFKTISTRLKPYNPIHYLLFSFFVNRQDFTIYYSTFYSGIFFKRIERKQMITVHDLMYFRIRNYFSLSNIRNWLYKSIFSFIVKSTLRCSNQIISVSKTTKIDLQEYYKKDSIVIGEGINSLNAKSTADPNIFGRFQIKPEKYFLYVGNFRRQKNIPFLIEAFIRSETSFQLVLVGDNNIKPIDNKNIILTGVLKDDEIQNLYKNCLAFVMPSLYEGFGMPILEAYTAGARVLSSNQGALTEFHRLQINYFSPLKLDELVSLMQNAENLPRPTEKDIELARKTYSWKSQTNQIIKCIEELMSS